MGEQLQRTKERAGEVSDETVQKTGSATVEQARKTAEEADTIQSEIDSLLEENIDPKDIESLLDAIDEVIEPNAQEYVESFRQKGGQ